jgi:hypothetical protein
MIDRVHPSPPSELGIIAGNGRYPILLAEAARRRGVGRLVVAAFTGETDPAVAERADAAEWMRVGQLGRLCRFFENQKIRHAVMAGQIAPGNLFDLRPDLKALMLLARLRQRNAESIFGAIAEELARHGVTLLPATTCLEDCLPPPGLIAGPKLKARVQDDIAFGYRIAKETSRLDIGQTVIVKHGTVLAVEAFEGTDETIRRGGRLGKGQAIVVKVSKPNQDFRFDVPVIGCRTVETSAAVGVGVIACEARKTLLLDREALIQLARDRRISLVAVGDG